MEFPTKQDLSSFTLENAKDALENILLAFKLPENDMTIKTGKENSGNDMLMHMQILFPIYIQIQMKVITKYGFTEDGEGIIKFTRLVKHYEKQDENLKHLNLRLRKICIPMLQVNQIDNLLT